MKNRDRALIYEPARIELVLLDVADVVCASGNPTGGSLGPGSNDDGGGWTA